MTKQVHDLRSALALLEAMPGELVKTQIPVDLTAELAGVYRRVGAGGTVRRPTRVNGPAMLFENIADHPGARVAIGVLGSRARCAAFFGCGQYELPRVIRACVDHPVAPVLAEGPAPCQQRVYRAGDPGFDLRRILPISTNTPVDAGPFITMGLCYAAHPDTGRFDATIHRLCVQGPDELSIFLQPGSRHIGAMAERASELGQPLPISVSIGLDPAAYILSCFEPPTTPLGCDELAIAGALRGAPVELVRCVSVDCRAIANAEFVIEGEILPGVRVREDQHTDTGFAMPEFPGYNGRASSEAWVLRVKAVTSRENPIMQTCIGPSEEHVNMAGLPTEASIFGLIEQAMPGKLTGIYAHRSGGGKYMAVLQFKKSCPADEGRQRQAALLAFSAFPELKHVILVDEDVDIHDTDDVLWAMNTRFQGDRDIIPIPGVRCHPLDPSSGPEYSPSIPDRGVSCKTIFDCTVPYPLRDRFQRAEFLAADEEKWRSIFEG